MRQVSLFKGVNPNVIEQVSIDSIFNFIRIGEYSEEISNIRKIKLEKGKKESDKIKIKLPSVTFSGTFSYRDKANLICHSNLISIDLDNLHDAKETKAKIIQDPYIFCCFISPGGDGLKCLIHTSATADTHEIFWESLALYFDHEYNLTADEKCRDVSRLCFLSADPDIYINSNSKIYSAEKLGIYNNKNLGLTNISSSAEYVPTNNTTDFDLLVKCDEITRKTHQPAPGTYNAYIVTFSL